MDAILHRRVKRCSLDVHPLEDALVLDYELEATVLGELGDAMMGERSCRKIIRVKSLSPDTKTRAVAWRVLEQCPFIPQSKLREVEQLLFYLKNRSQNHQHQESQGRPTAAEITAPPGIQEEASISCIEEYVELLYEDLQDKLRGSALVLQLAQNQDYLQELVHNEAVLGALARVLREDWRHSAQLASTILSVFCCLSRFSEFQPVVSHYKVGALSMTIMEQEIQKHHLWREEITTKHQECEQFPQNQSLKKDHEKSLRKFYSLVQKQDQLLTVCVSLLLNLSEDTCTEIKIRNKNIVHMLVHLLNREDPGTRSKPGPNQDYTRSKPGLDLLLVTVTFLKKLSIYVENKNEMVDCGVVQTLASLVRPGLDPVLLDQTLRLLLNLSFDSELRCQMVQAGLIAKLFTLIDESHRDLVLCVLYHLSLSERHRGHFTPSIPQLMQLLAADSQDLPLVSLCINLSLNQDNAQAFCSDGGVQTLMKRAIKSRDVLLIKMMRNLSQHGPTSVFLEHIETLASQVSVDRDEDFLLEVLGTLSNLRTPDLDWALVMNEFTGLLPFILNNLRPDGAEDDLLLVLVVLVGTVSVDEACASILARSGVIPVLLQLLNARQTDTEFVCQILHVFYQMVFYKDTRDVLLQDTLFSVLLMTLMHESNPHVCSVCDRILDVLSDCDETWFQKVQLERFRRHNGQWLEMVLYSNDPLEDADELYYTSPDRRLTPEFFSEFHHMDLGHVLINSVSETFAADRALTSFGFRPDEGFFLNFTTASR